MGLLSQRNQGFQTSRGVALGGIVALHVLAVALGMSMKGMRPDEVPTPEPIEITLQAESAPEVPQIKTQLQPIVPVAVVPDVQISVPTETTAITVAAPPPSVAKAPPSDASEGDGPVTVSRPDYLRLPSPVYPAAAKRARAQGVVHVRVLVDVEGLPRDVRVERSSGFAALDQAACDAVLRAQFKPYRRNSIARAMLVIVPVEFSLNVRTAMRRPPDGESELDVRGEHHHAVRRHAEELGGLGAASLHPGE